MSTDIGITELNKETPIKIQRTLYMLLEPNTRINDEYLGHLLRHLTEDDDCSDPIRIEEDFFVQWIKRLVENWSSSKTYTPKNILSFASNLTSFLIRNEEFFMKLNFVHVLEDFIEIIRAVPEPVEFPEIKISYINLISSFLQHTSGLQWLTVTSYWFDVITMASQGSSEEITKKSINFILNLLEETSKQNDVFCKVAIKMIVSPLTDVAISSTNDKDISVIETKAMKENIKLLNNILETLLERSCMTRNFTVLSIFLDNFDLEKSLNNIISLVENEETFIMLSLILNVILYCYAARDYTSTENKNKQYFSIAQRIAELIVYVVSRCKPYHKLFPIIQKSLLYGKYIYETIYASSTNTWRTQKQNAGEIFQNQMIIFLLWPITDATITMRVDSTDLRQELTSKVMKSLHSMTYKTMRGVKDFVHMFTIEDATKALEYLQICSPFYAHTVANMTTQILIYRFSDVLSEMDSFQGMNFWSQDFICLFIETLVIFLSTFDLTWKDSVETVFVTDIATQFLRQSFWKSKAIVKGLQLLDIAISKCLSPNMAFLMDDESDTHMNNQMIILESIISKKIADPNWEVRRMVMQVVKTVSQKAKKKFACHEKLLIQANIPAVVIDMAANDPYPQVKVKALECLQEIVLVEELWCYLLRTENIYDQAMRYFYLQEVDTVRSEALALLKAIFEHHKVPVLFQEKIYDCMIYAILKDGHNAVKLEALSFWDLVIKKELEHEGMIDGTFPAVTFSKVFKKIITFDDATIEMCLLRVLHRLGELGGLYVFLHIFETENNEEVINAAIKYITKFADLLTKYGIVHSSTLNSDDFYCSQLVGDSRDFMDELSDLQINCVPKCQRQNLKDGPRNHEVAFLEFLGSFDSYCDKRPRRNGRSDDLDTVLNKIFIN